MLENKKRIVIHLHSEEFAKDFKICHGRAICTYSNKLFKDCDYDKLVLVLRKLEWSHIIFPFVSHILYLFQKFIIKWPYSSIKFFIVSILITWLKNCLYLYFSPWSATSCLFRHEVLGLLRESEICDLDIRIISLCLSLDEVDRVREREC